MYLGKPPLTRGLAQRHKRVDLTGFGPVTSSLQMRRNEPAMLQARIG